MRRLGMVTGIQLAANAVLLGIGYYWLGVGEARNLTLLWSLFLAAFLVVSACCVYSAPLVYFRDGGEEKIVSAFRRAVRNLAPFVVAVVVTAGLVLLLNRASAKTATVQWGLRIAAWVVIPVLALPALAAIAERGWRGFLAAGSRVTDWTYWVTVPLLVLLTVRVPFLLLAWVPKVGGFAMQTVSFTGRAATAYLLFGAGWLALAFLSSGGRPRRTQSSTTDSE